ncbi:aminopeptidase N [Nonomuraea sp. NPDC047897]|uniref:aminopeptidase N n=1 Tax=Nonomuraea sp. NPDC047897 TaxID=3364346 RepID=UPI0037153BC9
MTAHNLTRDEAAQRAADLRVRSYSIELDFTDGQGAPSSELFTSTSTIEFDARAGSSSFVDLVAERVHRAELNGEKLLNPSVSGSGIELSRLAEHNTLVVAADHAYSSFGLGVHRFVDPTDSATYLYSQFESAEARRAFACFDQPDLKAAFTFSVVAPEDWTVISNSVCLTTEDLPGGGRLHTFAPTPPISTYVTAVAAGPYRRWTDTYTDEHGEIPLAIYCRESLAEHVDAERLFAETKEGFAYFHRTFGIPYAFGKYDQCLVPEFNAAAMESVALVTCMEEWAFRSKVSADSYERRNQTILHEIAHMWFGNLVSMKWWDDLWLKESFALLAAVLCQASSTAYTGAWTTFASVEKGWAYGQDQLASTHPVISDIPDLASVKVNYDSITYFKGAAVLKQLVAFVGEHNFFKGLSAYLTEHAYGTATLSDLLLHLQRASGRDLSGWASQWLATTGMNTLRPVLETTPDGKITSFEVVQGPASPGTGEFREHRVAVGMYDEDADGSLIRRHRVEIDVSGERTAVPELHGQPRGRLILVNDDDLTYCSMRLDPESSATLIDRISDVRDSLPRTLCWSAAWEMTREVELRARDFVSLVNRGFHEPAVAVVQRLVTQAQFALTSYADPAWAEEVGWPSLADGLLAAARSSAPGSDHQLILVSGLATAVLSPRHLDVLRALLDGEAAGQGLAGLAIDTDLRWSILLALSAAGCVDMDGVDTPVIDAAIADDATSAGAFQGARAAVLRPLTAAKERAWQQVMQSDSLAPTVEQALLYSFAFPGQQDLLEPFTDRYFDEIPALWARRSTEHARGVVTGLFPAWSIRRSTVDKAKKFAGQGHPEPLVRLVLEGAAEVERALRARAFDLGPSSST